MVTKGIVEEIINVYQAKVRLPVYDGFADTKNATPSDELTIASICNIPNIYNTIAVGDIVYVAFEDNDLGNPVILGQLYKEEMNTLADLKLNSANINQLTINKNTSLPQNTSIGSISSKEIAALSGIKDNIQNQLDNNLPAIEFAEEERQKSKNLFDFTKLTNFSGVKSNGDGSFDVNSTYYYPSARLDLQLDVGKTYTYSIDVNSYSEVEDGARIEIVLFYKDGSTWTINKGVTTIDRYSFSFAPVKEIDYIEIRFVRKSKADATILFTANVSNIQLEEGNAATGYQPYNGAIVHEKDIIGQTELLYGVNIENLNSSTMTTLSEYYNYIVSNPQKTFKCDIGNQETSNLKTLLGNPTGFANYTGCYLRNIGGSDDRTKYQIIEVIAIGFFVNKLAKGYIFYSDHTTATVTWTGWTILK